ncbi:Crp/Fnr family transcriptional regulator [Mesorhizobium sp. BAC0120]|uniref:Crp/Fnr family transcriptional regulator n=1 Tax=Mesorhizobium sp. BAC0120 TaxID=3090670 RepID=UPI00298D1C1A|nr:Crp/Fnr family transcriptional regulator [Mesorhizobium sp. BAC0120]MDW6026510.1 Crp/Fnr family transcriptional regulator [Mesorhizobium sp. BAC0120]
MPGKPFIVQLTRKLERHAPLLEADKSFLAGCIDQVVAYDRGETIIAEGSSPSVSCFVVEGFAARTKELADGTRQIMAFHIPGDFCDLHSFLLAVMDHSVEALSPCRVAKVSHAKIEEIVKTLPNLTKALWRDMGADAAIHRQWMVSMGRRSSYEQIAHLLCEMLLRLRAVGLATGNTYELPLTQQDLGDAFGLSTVHVNRMLQALRRGNLIVTKGKQLYIPDVRALAEAAAFDATYLGAGLLPSA